MDIYIVKHSGIVLAYCQTREIAEKSVEITYSEDTPERRAVEHNKIQIERVSVLDRPDHL